MWKNKFSIVLATLILTGTALSQEFKLLTPSILDLGTVSEDTIATGVIRFTNIGDNILKIGNIKTSCGCTAVDLEKLEYARGEVGEITVKFNTRGFAGIARKYVTIHPENIQPSSVRVTLQVNVLPKLEIEPRFIDFQDITINGKVYQRRFLVKNNTAKPLVVRQIKSNLKLLDIQPNSLLIKPGEQQTVSINFKPESELKTTGYLVLEVSEHANFVKRIPVFIKALPDNN
jgi:hypothetical protein